MNIALSIQYNHSFKEIAAMTVPVMQAYAMRHGYSLFVHRSERYSPEIVWQRMEDVQMLLKTHDAVAHMDADCLITNSSLRIQDLIGDSDADLFMSTDCNGINDGFCLWMDTLLSKLTIERLLVADRARFSSPQDAVEKVCAVGLDMQRMPQRLTNSYLMAEYPTLPPDPNAEWQPGDFILHLPGLSNVRRIQILQEHLCL